MTIVVSPARGGGIEIGGSIFLYDATYSDGATTARFRIFPDTAGGGNARLAGTSGNDIDAGPGSWTWIPVGAASAYEIYCQPISGSVAGSISATNTWLNLGTARSWTRNSSTAVLAITIRDVATQTTQATCTITLNT